MYVMESPQEAQRLLAQAQASDMGPVLQLTGLQAGARALDAGCGPGGIARLIAERVGDSGELVALDLSAERLQECSHLLQGRPNVRLLQADVRSTALPGDSFDYIWCQFVLQYLPDRHRAIAELVRLARPGGKVVLSEIDGFGLYNWPFSEPLQLGSQRMIHAMEQTGFDLYVGRKLYSELRQAGLCDVRVHLLPQYVIAGAADERHLSDWRIRFRTLEPVAAPAFGGVEPYEAWCREYLGMLADPGTLKYAVQLVTEGRKP